MKIAMLLLAAGRGSRFGGPVPKAYLPLAGQPLLVVGATRLARALPPGAAATWIVVTHPDDRNRWLTPHLAALRAGTATDAVRIADGGATRQASVENGLGACDADTDLVVVHDAARALPPIAATRACIDAAARVGAALLAIPAPDTLKKVRGDAVAATLDRTDVWQAQTPQVVRFDLLRRAFRHAAATSFDGTDDVSLVEHLGEPVAVVRGAPTNVKITQPADLPLAEAILAADLA